MNTAISYISRLKDSILDFLKEDDVKIIIFGSRARGNNAQFSDVDLGIIPGNGFNKKRLTLLHEHIDDLNIPYKVDLVDLSSTSDEFKNEILKDAEYWKD